MFFSDIKILWQFLSRKSKQGKEKTDPKGSGKHRTAAMLCLRTFKKLHLDHDLLSFRRNVLMYTWISNFS